VPEHRGMVQLFSQGFALQEVPFSTTGRSSADAQDKDYKVWAALLCRFGNTPSRKVLRKRDGVEVNR
jgi:hypothetical protein